MTPRLALLLIALVLGFAVLLGFDDIEQVKLLAVAVLLVIFAVLVGDRTWPR